MKESTLDITPSPRLLQVLGDIPLLNWQCLAELIDNSLDELLKDDQRSTDDPLRIDIAFDEHPEGVYLTVSDNGMGMTLSELERSLKAGHSSKSRYGSLGLFGMGFNIATARLGDRTTVVTSTAGSDQEISATIDFAELQRNETFQVPVSQVDCDSSSHGTTVRVRLKRSIADEVRRPAAIRTIQKQLGEVYSFLLRDGVPGIGRDEYSAPVPAIVTINGERLEAGLPCIWADSRSVTASGVEVSAVQYIDEPLTEATACLACGYWDRKNGPENCEECGSPDLELRQRRIWGWIGVQRYIDSSHYGIDFIRYGRKILSLDKTVFTYQDPDTLISDVEYPIEMPANQGRIVGEIHLDHVPVTYQKNDFDRQSRDWQVAIEHIRGTGPMKPRSARGVNTSPLAVIYSAFRRNDPGLRYLIPGDGKRAIHTEARRWAQNFEKGVVRYRTDSEWYEAAERHTRLKEGIPASEATSTGDSPGETGSGVIAAVLGDTAPLGSPHEGPTPVESAKELVDRAKVLGTERRDLSGIVNLGRGLGSWELSVITTKQELSDPADGGPAPARPGAVRGSEIEVLVCEEHPIFREYGRDVRDVALMQVAEVIRGYKGSSMSVGAVYAELVRAIPDLRVSEAALNERISRILERIKELMWFVVQADPETYWECLSAEDKAEVEMGATLAVPDVPLTEIVDDGSFIQYVGPDGLRRLVEARPDDFFEGRVFKPSVSRRSSEAKLRVVGTVVRDIQSLSDFQQDPLLRQKHDIALALISLEHLDSQMSAEDQLA